MKRTCIHCSVVVADKNVPMTVIRPRKGKYCTYMHPSVEDCRAALPSKPSHMNRQRWDQEKHQ